MIFTRSIRWRLQAWHALLLTAVIAGFGITAHRLASSDRLRAVDQELQSHVTQLGIAVPPSAAREAPRRGVAAGSANVACSAKVFGAPESRLKPEGIRDWSCCWRANKAERLSGKLSCSSVF